MAKEVYLIQSASCAFSASVGWAFLRGHDAGADIFQDFPPGLAVVGVGGEFIDGEFALCAPSPWQS